MGFIIIGGGATELGTAKKWGILIRNAPHLVHDPYFILPNYDWW